MLFSDFGKGSSTAHRRRMMATTSAFTDYEADLTNKDRAKAKEAVKKYLGERVKVDWEFPWPQEPTFQSPSSRDEMPSGWRERDEWESNESGPESGGEQASLGTTPLGDSPYRFESPHSVGDTIRKSAAERKRRRKKRLAKELVWNNGMRCFARRRNVWTGARHTTMPASSLDPQYIPSSAAQNFSLDDDDYEDEDDIDEIPIPEPLLPKENPIRANIGPAAYTNIYDKVVLQGQTPSVPINLADIVRSCVQGWQRDGEWPPKQAVLEPGVARRKEDAAGKGASGIRRSLQRVLGLSKGKEVEG
jgi:hypothetical protein